MQPSAIETLGLSAALFLGACLIFSRPRRGTPIQDLSLLGSSMGLGALTLASATAVDERSITSVVLVGALGTISHEVPASSYLPRPFLALGSVALFQHLSSPRWQAALLLAAVLAAALAVGPRVGPLLPHRWRGDLAVLLALAAAAFLAAPELLRGWDRSHVAAEAASSAPPQAEAPWAVAFVVGLFAVTLLRGLWRSARGSPISLRSTAP